MAFSFKETLANHPNNKWGLVLQGAQSIDPNELVEMLKSEVVSAMDKQFGIKMTASKEEITTGGLFSKLTQPGVLFKFQGKDYADWLVGFSKKVGMIDVEYIQIGMPSKAMQHRNMAAAKGFSLSGLAHKAMTDDNAVEEEEMHYGALLQTVQGVVMGWTDGDINPV